MKALGWQGPYFVDADHIGLKTVDGFVATSDFFTIDVADFIGKPAAEDDIKAFVAAHAKYAGSLRVPGIDGALDVTARADRVDRAEVPLRRAGGRARSTGTSRRRRATGSSSPRCRWTRPTSRRRRSSCCSSSPRSAREDSRADDRPEVHRAVQQGRRLRRRPDAVRARVQRRPGGHRVRVKEFGLPANLKLSVHSGSDKFSIYPAIRRAIRKTGAGLHIKTAGTTWLEELIGLGVGRRRGAGDREGRLRPGAGPLRRAVRPVRDRDRHRPGRSCRRPTRSRRGTASDTRARCGTTSRRRTTTRTCGSCCTSATRSRRRWASGTRTR